MSDAVLAELLSYRTEGFALRRLGLGDALPLFERITSDPKVTRFLPYRTHTALDQTVQLIQTYHALAPAAYMMGVTRHDELIGVVGLAPLGHSVALSHKFMRGAGRPALGFTFPFAQWLVAHPVVWRTWGYCDVENTAARRAVKAAGCTFEGVARKYAVHPNVAPWPRDCLIYSYCKGDQ